jgi:hypothetical protein
MPDTGHSSDASVAFRGALSECRSVTASNFSKFFTQILEWGLKIGHNSSLSHIFIFVIHHLIVFYSGLYYLGRWNNVVKLIGMVCSLEYTEIPRVLHHSIDGDVSRFFCWQLHLKGTVVVDHSYLKRITKSAMVSKIVIVIMRSKVIFVPGTKMLVPYAVTVCPDSDLSSHCYKSVFKQWSSVMKFV